MTSRVDDPAPAEPYDDALRWIIPSDSDPHASYVVELDSYKGNGECQCQHFECRMRPLLSRGITAEQAVAEGLIKLKADQRVEDALRCKHIIDAQKRFAEAMVGAFSKMRARLIRQSRQKQLRDIKEKYDQETLTPPPRHKSA